MDYPNPFGQRHMANHLLWKWRFCCFFRNARGGVHLYGRNYVDRENFAERRLCIFGFWRYARSD